MNRRRLVLFSLILYSSFTLSNAQVGCGYQLELYDSFGDGWNGGFLTVTLNGKAENYPFSDGFVLHQSIFGFDGDSLELSFTSGFFPFEASFRLFDAEGIELFYSGQNPKEGQLFSTTITCPACPNLPANGVGIEKIRHDQATIRWIKNAPDGLFLLKYVPTGESPDDASAIQVDQQDHFQLIGLKQHTLYDVYLQSVCSNGDTSNQIGPFTFQTLWAKDVGVETLKSPMSDCDLPADGVISLVLKNYGGAPQTLIPFNYSINGIPGSVSQPNDGVFTGILSYNGTYTVNFDAPFDFSKPQLYEIKVWTELEGDDNPANDTLFTTVIHTPVIYEFPYTIDFEEGAGGWMLDADSKSPSLELGQPSGNVINMANSGQNAWVTNLDGNYNNQERSMLLSPCLNFSALNKDPELAFSIWVSTEPTFDGAWVEISVSGGAWTKLGMSGDTGIFWYNVVDDINGDWWSGNNIFGGWRKVRHPLTGLAGEPDVRIRIVFSSDDAVVREGIGIDDIFIAPPLENNLSAQVISNSDDSECGSEETAVTLTFRNEGSAVQNDFRLSYQVNDAPVVTENVSMVLDPDANATYTFATTFNSSSPDEYVITAWTDLFGEEYPANDTIVAVYSTAGPGIPYLENFEARKIPDNWTVDTDIAVENSHNSGSFVLFDNLWEEDTLTQAITPILGPIENGDTLFFAYRFVNFMGMGLQPTVLKPGDALRVEISEDCGQTFNEVLLIDMSNHQIKNTLRTIGLPLDDYVNQWIKVRFRASWGNGDYFFDLDNVNIRRCPSSLNIHATVSPPTDNQNNGSIRVEPAGGIMPYFYFWNNGFRQASISGLAPGTYQVTVTDQQGCTDDMIVTLEPTVGIEDRTSKINSIHLAPNPNSGYSMLDLDLDQSYDVGITIFDARGSLIHQKTLPQITRINYPVDLSTYPNGVYFIRVLIQNEVKTLRLLKANRP